jgi:lycopene cyclase domain-containing protein
MWGNSTYVILILVWAGPVIVIQWLLGADLLIRRWKVLIPGVLLPTLYLTLIDSFALRSGTWTISTQQSLNLFLPIIGVPIEEAIFFLVTNTLIIQGMILFLERSRVRARVDQILTIGKRKPEAVESRAQ